MYTHTSLRDYSQLAAVNFALSFQHTYMSECNGSSSKKYEEAGIELFSKTLKFSSADPNNEPKR